MPSVVDLWSYGDTGFHSLAAAVVKDRYPREAMQSAFRILGEGQLSLTKFLILTDARIDVRNFKGLLEHVLARCDSRRDLFVFSNVSMDTLDYTGPRVNEGSKGVLLGLGAAARELPRAFEGKPPAGCRAAAVYCAGCLVVEGSTAGEDPELPARVAADPAVAAWPLVVLADDAVKTTSSDAQFLWRVFTRFEPAADLRGAAARIVRNHVAFEAPVVLDARVKPWFPSEVDPDAETSARVDRRWKEYFPSGT
jgi:3-polyprenyl-4-hydroxybenzoate decarboxylase